MRALFGVCDSDSEPDANNKHLDSMGDSAASQITGAATDADAEDAEVPNAVSEVLQQDTPLPAPAVASTLALEASPAPPSLQAPVATTTLPAELPVSTFAHSAQGVHREHFFDASLHGMIEEDSENDDVEAEGACAGMHVLGSASEDSEFEHGPAMHELRSGRHSKLEGNFFGDEQVGALTLHTKFEAAPGASKGYKTLERGMGVDAEGCLDYTWLVRIIGGSIAGSEKGKPQRRYVALLYSDYDSSANEIRDAWYYAPLRKLTPLGPIEIGGKVACNSRGKPKLSFNCGRHAADKALAEWVPQSINTLSRKAGELTPRVPRAEKKARSK